MCNAAKWNSFNNTLGLQNCPFLSVNVCCSPSCSKVPIPFVCDVSRTLSYFRQCYHISVHTNTIHSTRPCRKSWLELLNTSIQWFCSGFPKVYPILLKKLHCDKLSPDSFINDVNCIHLNSSEKQKS